MYDEQILVKQLSNGNPVEYKMELMKDFKGQCISYGYGKGWEKCMCLIRLIKAKHRRIIDQDRSKMIDDLRDEIARKNA